MIVVIQPNSRSEIKENKEVEFIKNILLIHYAINN